MLSAATCALSSSRGQATMPPASASVGASGSASTGWPGQNATASSGGASGAATPSRGTTTPSCRAMASHTRAPTRTRRSSRRRSSAASSRSGRSATQRSASPRSRRASCHKGGAERCVGGGPGNGRGAGLQLRAVLRGRGRRPKGRAAEGAGRAGRRSRRCARCVRVRLLHQPARRLLSVPAPQKGLDEEGRVRRGDPAYGGAAVVAVPQGPAAADEGLRGHRAAQVPVLLEGGDA
eukprot:5173706-Prymnesium_polylepis.1